MDNDCKILPIASKHVVFAGLETEKASEFFHLKLLYATENDLAYHHLKLQNSIPVFKWTILALVQGACVEPDSHFVYELIFFIRDSD